ncbi:MAG: hypothetical protein V4662_17640 [Verrucomicrobiota bacterium]
MKSLLFLSLLSLASMAGAQTVGQLGIPKWTASGTQTQWITPQNDKVIGIDGSGNLVMVAGGGASSLGSLSGVSLSGVTSGQLFRYNGSAWTNWTPDFITASALTPYLLSATAATTYQPKDDDLSEIADIATTAYGRDYLTTPDQTVARERLGLDEGASVTFDQMNANLRGSLSLPENIGINFDHLDLSDNLVTSTITALQTNEGHDIHWPTDAGTILTNESVLNGANLGTGSVTTAKLANPSMTINGVSRSLGDTFSISASPGGSSGQPQYNNAGSFAGFTGLTLTSGEISALVISNAGTGNDIASINTNGQGAFSGGAYNVPWISTNGGQVGLGAGSPFHLQLIADGTEYAVLSSSVFQVGSGHWFEWGTLGNVGNAAGHKSALGSPSAGVLQLGHNNATTPVDYTLKGNDTTTGTGGAVNIQGGTGSVAGGAVTITTSTTTTPAVRITVKATGVINFASLPTSAAGLSSGDLWNDSGAVKVVP